MMVRCLMRVVSRFVTSQLIKTIRTTNGLLLQRNIKRTHATVSEYHLLPGPSQFVGAPLPILTTPLPSGCLEPYKIIISKTASLAWVTVQLTMTPASFILRLTICATLSWLFQEMLSRAQALDLREPEQASKHMGALKPLLIT